MDRLLATMRRLRGPGGCPWDQKQTHLTLRQYLLEEAYEAVDAITRDHTADMVEELGDVLLQIAFHTVIAEETSRFFYEDIETAIVDKLIRRHPHVFGDVQLGSAEEVVVNWQAIKAKEKADLDLPADDIPNHLPALMLATEVSKQKNWMTEDFDIEATQDIGEALLKLVNQAREQGINPEIALRDAVARRIAKAP